MLFTVLLFASVSGIAQSSMGVYSRADMKEIQKKYGLNPKSSIISRLNATPQDVITIFKEAGMESKEHKMTQEETQVLANVSSEVNPNTNV